MKKEITITMNMQEVYNLTLGISIATQQLQKEIDSNQILSKCNPEIIRSLNGIYETILNNIKQ